MAYRNKTYVCFDADSDIHYYRLMQAWKENERIAFDFHNAHELNNLRDFSSEETIKRKLHDRLKNTKVMIVLIGEKTRYLYKFVRWEIEWAIENKIPIIAVNLNKKIKMDQALCPPLLRGKLAIHIPYGHRSINYALNNWPNQHYTFQIQRRMSEYYYLKSVYINLGYSIT